MDLTLHRSLATLIFTHSLLATATITEWVASLPSYTDPDDNWMYKSVSDPDGDVYVGGYNALFHFSGDLELKQMVTTGPVMDHPDCMHPSYPCNARKEETNNHNRVLQLVYNLDSRPSLLACGTVYRMLCQIRPADNLTEYHWVHPFNESVGYSAAGGNTFSYFGPGYDSNQTLITVSSMESNYSFAPFISSKVVEKDGDHYSIRYSFQNETAKSALEFSSWTERSIYDRGVEYEGFVYFSILYSPESIDDHDTRLVRVCIHDGTFRSYSELPIACDHPTGQFTTNGYALHLDDSPSSEGKSLYVIFSRDDEGHTGSVICIFPMTDVIRAFTAPPRKCIKAVGHSCQPEIKTDITDFCGPDVIPFSVIQPLVVSHFTFLADSIVTVITTVKYNDEMVAIVGDKSGDVQKISLTSGKIISKNHLFDMNSTSIIYSPFLFDRDHQHIYIMKESQIVKFPIKSCRVHETCESCFTEGKIDPLNCGWCGTYCAHSKECNEPDSFSRDTCSPVIYEVTPQKGPIQGAVKITITGDNFGPYVDGGQYSVTVAGIPCKVFKWEYREVTCILGQSPEETSGPVKLNVSVFNSSSIGYNVAGSAASKLNFSYYVGPRLFGIHPNKGPTSGGTNITLFGENLDYEKDEERYFIVRGRICNLKGFNTTTAWCVTDKEARLDYPDQIAVVVGNVTYIMEDSPTFKHTDLSQSFEYTPDPEILQLQPGITTVSGLINVTVTGLHLDSIFAPQIVVKVALSKITSLELIEKCWSDTESRGTQLTCSTPSLVDELWLPKPTRTSPLLTHVSFIMDGVQWLREFSLHQEFMSRLLYYPDPEFEPFREVQKISDDQTTMEIKGNNLGVLNSVDNFHIKLGQNNSCKITIVSTELLLCELPPSLKNSSLIETNISVRFFMGSTSHQLGYIKFHPVEQNSDAWWPILLAIYILGPCIVVVIAFLCFRKLRKKKSERNTSRNKSISNRTETSFASDNPPVPPRPSLTTNSLSMLSFDSTSVSNEEPWDETVILDSERLFILEELGLIIQKKHLLIGELIGSGQFGKVYKGTLQIPNKKETEVAIKTLYRHLWKNPIKAELFMKEALTMKDFDHPNVLGLLGVCFEGSVPHIVLPFMEHGDLCNYIRDKTKTLLISDLLKFAVDVTSGMCYLSKLKFVHRDLAARNCVLDSSLRAKVADFGLSRDIYEGNYYRSQDKHAELPFRWTAPEVIETQISTTQSDVWSYGVLLWELMTRGSIPYANIGNWDVLAYIKLGNRLNQPQFCPKPLYLSMLACWNTDPKTRPSFFKLHSFVSEIHGKFLNDIAESSPSAATVADNPIYFQFTVPAQNTVYYNSKELYLKMDGRDLNIDDIDESYVVMKGIEDTYVIMNEENIFAAQTKF